MHRSKKGPEVPELLEREGIGVSPDIEVWDDPNILMQGRDPQIERIVSEVLLLLESNPPMMTPAPPLEDRTAEGLSNGKE